MSETAAPTTDQLARLVGQKRRLLEHLVRLGRGQGELAEAGRTQDLLKLLAEKQRFIDGLRTIEQGLAAFRDDDPESRDWPTPEHRTACQADSEACNRLLAEVLANEQNHEQVMTQRREQISTQLRQAQHAHAASTAYKPHLRATPQPAATLNLPATPGAESLDLTTTD